MSVRNPDPQDDLETTLAPRHDTLPQSPDALRPLTAALLDCVTPAEVAAVVVDRGLFVLDAKAGLVALVTEKGDELEVVRAHGYAPDLIENWYRFSLNAHLPLSDCVRENRVLLFQGRKSWQAHYPEMMEKVPNGNFMASAALPLSARGHVFGGLHFSFAEEREFTKSDADFLGDLAQQCALALDRALLLEQAEQARLEAEIARDRAQFAQKRLAFLAQASALLGESLDYQTRLEALTHLCIPVLADWAGVDVLKKDGELQRLAVAHVHSNSAVLMREIQDRYPPREEASSGPLRVARTGDPFFVPEVTAEMIAHGAQDAEHERLLKLVGVRAVLCLPLITRGKILGVLTLGMAPAPEGSGRSFPPEMISLAEELARRAAIAVDNALLYIESRESEHELARREQDYAALVDNAPDVLARFNKDFQFLYINEQGTRNTGISRKDYIGRTFRDLGGLPEENIRLWERALSEVFQTGEPRHIEYGFPTPGGFGYFECDLTPEFRDDGSVNTVVTITRNVTDRRLLEIEREAQQKAQRKFMREMVYSLTEGRLTLCETEADLPKEFKRFSEVVELTRPTLRILRKQVQSVTESLNFSTERLEDFETAVSEGAMNAVVHAGGGEGWVCADAESGVVQVWVRDSGMGINAETLPRVLEKGISSVGTLGHGFSLMLKMADRIWLLTRPQGTTVVFEQDRTRPEPAWLKGL